jgi:hypothetical protein
VALIRARGCVASGRTTCSRAGWIAGHRQRSADCIPAHVRARAMRAVTVLVPVLPNGSGGVCGVRAAVQCGMALLLSALRRRVTGRGGCDLDCHGMEDVGGSWRRTVARSTFIKLAYTSERARGASEWTRPDYTCVRDSYSGSTARRTGSYLWMPMLARFPARAEISSRKQTRGKPCCFHLLAYEGDKKISRARRMQCTGISLHVHTATHIAVPCLPGDTFSNAHIFF